MSNGGRRFKTQLKGVVLRTLSGLRMLKLFNPLTRGSVSIFMLHRMEDDVCGIRGHTSKRIIEALEYLRRNHFNVVSLDDALRSMKGEAPPLMNAVAFTMDDGYLDQAEEAAVIFQKFDVPLTIFVITGFIDGILWPWDARAEFILNSTKNQSITLSDSTREIKYHCANQNQRRRSLRHFLYCAKQAPQDQIDAMIQKLSLAAEVNVPKDPPAQYRPLTWEMARNLEKSGSVRFGAHGVSHRILSRLSSDDAEYEIRESWNRVSAELSAPLDIFCYPIGRANDYGQREIDVLKKMGLRGAVTAKAGYASFDPKADVVDQVYALSRFAFPDNHEDFIQYSTGIEKVKSLIRMRQHHSCASLKLF